MAQKHSPIGASSMHRWANCAASVRLSKGLESKPSKYAEEGTKAHEVAAAHLSTVPYDSSQFDEEMLEAAEFYAETIWADQDIDPDSTLLVEHAFDLKSIYPGLYGTADAVLYTPSEKLLRVIDFKYGAGISVEVENNEQLMYYALGALGTTKFDVQEIELVIIQPRVEHEDGKVRRFRFPIIDILDFEVDLIEFVKRTEDASLLPIPGDWCRFCPASALCPALTKQATELVKTQFSPTAPYSPQKLALALEMVPKLKAWAESVNEFAYHEAKAGRVPPGFKLVEKRATRKWKDEVEAALWLEDFLAREEMYKTDLKSPAQIEKLIPKDEKGNLPNFVESISSGEVLVPDSDKRPEVTARSVLDQFKPVKT